MIKLSFLFGLVLLLGIAVWWALPTLIYPPLHRDQPRPLRMIKKPVSAQVIEHGNRKLPEIALTFDADMTPQMALLLKTGVIKSLYNAKIKETLDQNNTKATVFLGGLWTSVYPNEAKALAADPLIEIGNHSYNHYAFSTCFGLRVLPNEQNADDITLAQKTIIKVTGMTPKYFRFPGGCYEKINLDTVAKLGLTVVHWDVVAGDGFNKNPDNIVYQVESRVQNGSIVVMHIHDGSYAPRTNDALVKIIPDLKKRGFEFVKISELLNNL